MSPTDIEALDRLEEKLKRLVSEIDKLRTDKARQAEEHRRLSAELDAARARLETAESGAAEVETLRQERDQIRSRVADILGQLEGLDL